MNTQRSRRRKLLSDWDIRKVQVLERDHWMCMTCGMSATCVNHVLGRKYKKLFLDMRYLISSCFDCNADDVADTIGGRRERIQILMDEYGYDYSDCPDKQYTKED